PSLAVHPARIPVLVVLLLPDGHPVFHFVDDVPARQERLMPVARAHANPHRQITDREVSDPVYAERVLHAETFDGFADDPLAFLYGQRHEGFVLESRNGLALVVIPHPTFERAVAAAARVAKLRCKRCDVERVGAEAEGAHGSALDQPPATGGMNTTASPSESGCDQSPNSEFTATRSISGASENG